MAALTHHVDADTVWLDFEMKGRRFMIDAERLRTGVAEVDERLNAWLAEATSDAALARARRH